MWLFAKAIPVKEEVLTGVWYQKKNPVAELNYKHKTVKNNMMGGNTVMKNGKPVIAVSRISNMYMRIDNEEHLLTGATAVFGEFFTVTTIPRVKFTYHEKQQLAYYYPNNKNVLLGYEPVTNAALIKKLDCLVDKSKEAKLKEENRVKNDILKKSLSYPCR